MNKPHAYDYTIDAIRVIGIVLVIIIHVSGQFVNQPQFFLTPQWWIPNLIDSASRIAVPLFVMISGFLILGSKRTAWSKDYFTRRITRIGIPLIAWSIIYLIFQKLFWSETYTIPQIIGKFFQPYIYYHLYFLYIILGLYCVAPLLGHLIQKISENTQRIFLTIFFFYSAVLYVIIFFVPGTHSPLNGLTLFIPYVPFFVAGYYFRNTLLSKKNWWLALLVFCLLSIVTAFLNKWYMQYIGWSVTHQSSSRYFYEHFSPNVILESLLAFTLLRSIPRIFSHTTNPTNKNIIEHLAPLVFGIYLLHPMLLDMLDRYFPLLNTRIVNSSSICIAFIAKTVLLFVMTYVIVYLCKKIRPIAWIFG